MEETKKEIAIKFLKTLGVMKEVREDLEDNDVKYYSERQNMAFDGVLYYLSNRPEWEEKIAELEKEYGIYVYHAYHYFASYGEVLDLLYIPRDEEDIEAVWQILESDKQTHEDALEVPIYAINLTEPDFSEFGCAGYKVKIGGLSKVY